RDKSGFTGRPRIPGYAPRNGRKEIYFTNQTCVIKDGKLLKFPMTKETLNIGKLGAVGRLKEVRVLPRQDHYIVEVVLEKETIQTPIMTDTPTHIGGIDLGLDNFAAIKTNSGLRPVLVKGNEIKAINQLYNKRRAKYQSLLKENQHDSRQLRAITRKRNDQVQDFLHKASRFVVTYALHHRIDTLVVGKNEAMKQGINIGRRNNQGFVQLPHARFIDLLRYKCAEAGIRLTVTEESYTSKASALDGDDLPVYSKTNEKPRFSGTRIHRGLYRSKDGTLVNADVNGAANIIRKVYPQALSAEGVAGLVTAPLVITRSILNGIPGLC
ncbi:MAG: transposase, partial [Erysipelotrichaceae bacterium]|nr:transposase [Erysipelotrichaceae bacterium]